MQQVPSLPRAKSCSTASVLAEERVSAKKLAKHSAPGTNLLMLIAPSKKHPAGKTLGEPVLGWYGHGEAVGEELTLAHTESFVPVAQSAPLLIRSRLFLPPTHL